MLTQILISSISFQLVLFMQVKIERAEYFEDVEDYPNSDEQESQRSSREEQKREKYESKEKQKSQTSTQTWYNNLQINKIVVWGIRCCIVFLVLVGIYQMYLYNHTTPHQIEPVSEPIKQPVKEVETLNITKQSEKVANMKKQEISLKKEVQKMTSPPKIEDKPVKKEEEIAIKVPEKPTNIPKIIQSPKQPPKQTSTVEQTKHQPLDIGKKVWYFQTDQDKNYFDQLITANNKYFTKKSGFQFISLTAKNYHEYLSLETRDKIHNFLSLMQSRILDPDYIDTNLRYHIKSIQKKLALLCLLQENGGIAISERFTITQTFQWIKNIKDNIHVNRGNGDQQPEVVGFYSPYYSSGMAKQQKRLRSGQQQVDKYMVLYPAIEDYFIAAKKKAKFLGEFIDTIIRVLVEPNLIRSEISKGKLNIIKMNGGDIYYEYFVLAAQRVLQLKQFALDSKNKKEPYRTFAIDHYGLELINCHYGPYKVKIFWGNNQSPKIIQNMAKYDIKEHYAGIGNMRYIQSSTIPREMNDFLTQVKRSKTQKIMKGSYIQKMYFPEAKQPFIYDNKEKPAVHKDAKPWNIPKIIWIYWDKGIKNSKASTQLCILNLRRLGKESGFIVNEVNDTNLGDFLDKEILDKIQFTLKNAKVRVYPQSKSDFYRLALVAKHGGIYMDASYLLVENLDWLINIGRYPTEYIFNRYGDLPNNLMFWHPHYGSPFQWSVDEKTNTKIQWHLAYENNFIAAVKESEFVKEWLQLYMQMMLKTYEQIYDVFNDCNMISHKWIGKESQYLLAMDCAKCVVGRRQKMIIETKSKQWKDACDYYKLWSMSGYLGQQKFRSSTNYENPGSDDHYFLYRYSQEYVEGLLGKVMHLTKLYGNPNRELNNYIGKNIEINANLSLSFHSKSIFRKFLYDKDYPIKLYNDGAKLLY